MLKFLAPFAAVVALGAFALPGHAAPLTNPASDVIAQCEGKKNDKPSADQPKPTENCEGKKGEGRKKGEGKGKGKRGGDDAGE